MASKQKLDNGAVPYVLRNELEDCRRKLNEEIETWLWKPSAKMKEVRAHLSKAIDVEEQALKKQQDQLDEDSKCYERISSQHLLLSVSIPEIDAIVAMATAPAPETPSALSTTDPHAPVNRASLSTQAACAGSDYAYTDAAAAGAPPVESPLMDPDVRRVMTLPEGLEAAAGLSRRR